MDRSRLMKEVEKLNRMVENTECNKLQNNELIKQSQVVDKLIVAYMKQIHNKINIIK
ncbi:Spo0E family sporulation regulatory protein-aspartic acid phosphatase [Caloramator sp. mosi_1]|uniref:Spo0E family sporulation regulatory protein-aspartic acid phosphatase n=1 Tax=Caloramator sp. mosi_1 TaxID=3023090 RepID=UPI00235F4E5F|nr:Spo0E family sporulation regulatory protein-aspartic acid phosphatase [Caloramator sp. mosi_1]WDC83609.1 Spo0E family sporulation regulatory protein-aspartic acid phosphatase [Caloramator sp. mosi_1]